VGEEAVNPKAVVSGFVTADDQGIVGQSEACLVDMDRLLSAIGLEVIHILSLTSATHVFPPP